MFIIKTNRKVILHDVLLMAIKFKNKNIKYKTDFLIISQNSKRQDN